jgi:hypothetical protein
MHAPRAQIGQDPSVAHRCVHATALSAALAACSSDAPDGIPSDAPLDPVRSEVCAHQGTSSVTGTGPAGSLGPGRIYAIALSGFCSDALILIITTEAPLAYPYFDGTGVILAPVNPGNIGGGAEWSGTFDATISLPDETKPARGTLQVDRATPGYPSPTLIRATARFDEGDWHFTATIDGPYCQTVTCL